MKRLIKTFSLCLAFMITVCGSFISIFALEQNGEISADYLDKLTQYPLDLQEIRQRDDLVTEIQGKIENPELWNSFYSRIKNGESAEVVIAQATTEGDPVLHYVRCDMNDENSKFLLIEDWSRDRFSGDEEPRFFIEHYAYLQELTMGDYDLFLLTDRLFDSAEDYQEYTSNEPEKMPMVVLREVISGNKETGKETLFSDVPADAWYAESLRENVEMGLLSGYGDGTFEPQHAIYWWTLAQVLYNFTEGYDLDWWTDFADETSVRIPWYQPVVKFASGFGLIPYRPDEAFALEWPTRFQVIQSFYQLGIRTEAIDSSQNRALDWALENKILIGDENGDLRLEDHISRAELSEVLQRVWPIFEGHRFITRLYFIDEQDVEYIFIRDGNNGNGITYTDRETIHDVVERLNRFRTDRAADGRAGGYNASLRLVMKQPGKLIGMNISAGGVSTGRIGYHALDQGLFTDAWIDALCRRQ